MKNICMALIITACLLIAYNHQLYCDDNAKKSQIDIALEKIAKENDDAQKAIENSVRLIRLATGSTSKPGIDKLFDNLIKDVGKTLAGIDDRSELMSLIIKFKQNIREKIKRYRDEPDEQRFWIKQDKELTAKEGEIHRAREKIGETLEEVIKGKYDIYKQLEKQRVTLAVGSLGELTVKLEALRTTLSRIRKIPYELKASGAPVN